jgi:hypothetical protein
MHPRSIIILGLVLVVLGFVLPLLMVLRTVEASFFHGFLSYGASISRLLLGLMGAAWYVRAGRECVAPASRHGSTGLDNTSPSLQYWLVFKHALR